MEKFFNQIKNTISKLKTNKILILGKGPSLDDFISYKFKNYFIININDSYKFYEGDLVLLNKPWAFNEINKLKKKPIILSQIKQKNIIKKNLFFIKDLNEIKSSLIKNSFDKNKPLFLFALELIYNLSLINKEKYEIYLLGLDFNFKNIENYTSNYLQDFDNNSILKKKYILKKQKSIFIKIIKNRKIKHKIDIKHIGNLDESFCSNSEFIKNEINIFKDKQIKPDVKIVAEVTTNHFGDLNLLFKMVKLIKEAGADYVKIQKRDPNTFYSKKELDTYYYSKFGSTFREYRNGLELSLDQLQKFDKFCKKIKIKWFATVLDIKSYEIIKKFKPSLIKIPSTISTYKSFHEYLSINYRGSIVISTGSTSSSYEDYILNKFKRTKKIYLLQCTSSYPTKDQDCNIGVINRYRDIAKKNKKIIPGFSSHDLGFTASIMSVAAGARMIEKHVFFESKPWAHFDKVALNLKNGEFKNYVENIRKAQEIYGNEKKIKLKSEFHKYKKK